MSKTQAARLDFWRQLIAKQQQSGMSVRAFCPQHRIRDYSFYHWRKRLREQLPMKFALFDTHRAAPTAVAAVEVMLTTGERVRIVPGIDAATLRLVLSVSREPR
jgi:transposase-like protein